MSAKKRVSFKDNQKVQRNDQASFSKKPKKQYGKLLINHCYKAKVFIVVVVVV